MSWGGFLVPLFLFTVDLVGQILPEGSVWLLIIPDEIGLPIDPLTCVLHSLATFGVAQFNESLITFLFVHLSTFARGIVPGNWYFPAFRPASGIDVQSLPCGLCCQPNNKADGISPPR